jgi:hypothetical protein
MTFLTAVMINDLYVTAIYGTLLSVFHKSIPFGCYTTAD